MNVDYQVQCSEFRCSRKGIWHRYICNCYLFELFVGFHFSFGSDRLGALLPLSLTDRFSQTLSSILSIAGREVCLLARSQFERSP